jgi:type II secretory pathway pseudopilin PulG
MDTLLLVVTVISVIAAVIAFTSAHRANKRERDRSEARAAALAAAAETHGSQDGGWRQVAGEWQWTAEPPAARHLDVAGERDEHDGRSPTASATDRMFGTVERTEPSGSRLPLAAAAALILVLGGALVFLNSSGSDERPTAAQTSQAQAIELVSLGHARDVALLTITGAVRNPSSGVKLEGLTAVISLLDRNGALVSTKDVPLDYRAIAPGEEAPFRVTIPDSGAIARYRVSFRAGTDVVPHVDRRLNTKLASALE